MNKTTIIAAMTMAGAIAATSSCSNDPYETGDGALSYLHADYADITVSNATVADILTDDDVHLVQAKPLAVSSELPPDTMLRRLVHYSRTDASSAIEILQLTPVAIVMPRDPADVTVTQRDPLKLTAAWLSRNRRYLNLQLGIMVGNSAGEEALQQLQFACDSIHTEDKGAIFLSLRHDQAGMPEYYTEDVHVSLPIGRLVPQQTVEADTISLTIDTYAGRLTKLFIK